MVPKPSSWDWKMKGRPAVHTGISPLRGVAPASQGGFSSPAFVSSLCCFLEIMFSLIQADAPQNAQSWVPSLPGAWLKPAHGSVSASPAGAMQRPKYQHPKWTADEFSGFQTLWSMELYLNLRATLSRELWTSPEEPALQPEQSGLCLWTPFLSIN